MKHFFEKHFTIETLELSNETIIKVDSNLSAVDLYYTLKLLMEQNENYALVFLMACADYREKNKAGI